MEEKKEFQVWFLLDNLEIATIVQLWAADAFVAKAEAEEMRRELDLPATAISICTII